MARRATWVRLTVVVWTLGVAIAYRRTVGPVQSMVAAPPAAVAAGWVVVWLLGLVGMAWAEAKFWRSLGRECGLEPTAPFGGEELRWHGRVPLATTVRDHAVTVDTSEAHDGRWPTPQTVVTVDLADRGTGHRLALVAADEGTSLPDDVAGLALTTTGAAGFDDAMQVRAGEATDAGAVLDVGLREHLVDLAPLGRFVVADGQVRHVVDAKVQSTRELQARIEAAVSLAEAVERADE